jgi:DDE family transposase
LAIVISPPEHERKQKPERTLGEQLGNTKPKFSEQDLEAFKYFDLLQPLLEKLHKAGTERDRAGNRDLFYDQYATMVLLYFFNPVLTSLRGIQQASGFRKVQRELGVAQTSLGSLSEAARVFDAQLLHPIIRELADQLVPVQQGAEAEALKTLTAVDGSLLPALPKMAWALWNYDDKKAARLHLHFEVLKSAPIAAKITEGKSCEKKALHQMLEAGRFYVFDRGYEQFRLFQEIIDIGSSFVCCVRDQMTWKVIQERSLSEAARAAGVVFDAEVHLGGQKAKGVLKQPLRVVQVDIGKTDEHGQPVILTLITDKLDLDAELIALAYRFRWQIELFFRWLKCILGCRHLLSTSRNGVEIQVYLALIASLLIALWVGRKPTKRTYEMLCFYFLGVVELDELTAHIANLEKQD